MVSKMRFESSKIRLKYGFRSSKMGLEKRGNENAILVSKRRIEFHSHVPVWTIFKTKLKIKIKMLLLMPSMVIKKVVK